ncbi:MAG: ferritin-like domain-containing protein [Acidobacteriaceae bacterium]|jgi:hypothetical protein
MASNEIEILDPTASVGKLKKIAAGHALNRRHFLAALGMTGAAAGAGMMSGCSTSNSVAVTTASTAQVDMLNFALNVKYLQATFYSFIAKGTDLTGSAVTNSGPVTGAPTAALSFAGVAGVTNPQQVTDILNEIYYDEKNHVSTLLGLLGVSAVFRPAINLAGFGTITATNALSIARLLEDVGVTAYAGIIGSLSSSDITLLGQIMGADSLHAGILRLTALQNPTVAAYIKADTMDVAPFDLGATSNAGPTASGGFFATAGASTASTATPAGFAFTRTISQVFSILFGTETATGSNTTVTLAAIGTTSGGFFPNGVNGNLNKV